MSITLQKASETLKNLNADLGTKTSNVVPSNSGTYALINDMISNLSSIKASIKTEEKDPIQTIITTTDVLNVEQSGLILEGKNVETHKLELDWNT